MRASLNLVRNSEAEVGTTLGVDMEAQIYGLIEEYVTGHIGVDAFNTRLSTLTWGAGANSPAASLIGDVELLLAELSAGHRSEQSVARELRHLLRTFRATLPTETLGARRPLRTGTSGKLLSGTFTLPSLRQLA